MATLTRSSASLDTSTGMFAPQITGDLYAGEALDAAAPCYIKQSDGKVYMCNGTTKGAEATKFDGFTPRACAIGEPVTLFGVGARFRYGSALTIGARLYISATAGRLDDAPSAGGVHEIARVINSTDIRITATRDAQAGTFAQSAVFISTEQTGTGAPQNVAHGLGVAPAKVFVAPTDTAPATTGAYTVTEGAHDATNVIVTVTTGKKFKVMAWA